MRWLRRLLLLLLIIILVPIVLVVGIIAADASFGAEATDYTNVSYPAADGTTLHSYLAMPEGEGPFPGVLMVHEWWGLNGEITELADRMAEEGYVVLAPDTYRNATTNQIPRALYLRITVPEDRVDGDMQAAFDYLATLSEVDSETIGVIGFCYGGGVALRYAIDNPEIAATVNLYGDMIADPTAFGALLEEGAGPVLGIFGREDAQIPVEEVQAFDQALDTAEIDNTVTIYDGMGHAFVQPEVIDEGGAPEEAWQQILAFFDDHLRSEDA